MNPREPSIPPPLASPRRVRKPGPSGCQPNRSRAARPQPDGDLLYRRRLLSMEVLKLNSPAIVCEIFKEDLSSRAQRRRLLWEFFD